MKSFNWAEWSLNHRQLVYFFAFLFFVAGLFSFKTLGRMEDPSYTVKQMIVSSAWPGATATEVEQHLTDKLEKQIRNVPQIDYVTSYSRPGVSVIKVYLKDEVPAHQVRQRWLEIRNMVKDIEKDLPQGVYGPYFNDRFDDVYGNIYALTGEGYSYEEIRQYAEKLKRSFLTIKDVKKIELVGVQKEKIFINMKTDKLSQLGLDINSLATIIKAQTAVTPSGMLDTEVVNNYLRVTGEPSSLEALKNIPINANGKILRLGDIAQLDRSYADPPDSKMYYNGRPAIGIAISMEDGGNNIELGENIAVAIKKAQEELPLGLEINQVANQPEVVKKSIDEFSESLYEAIAIVLAVSLFTLGRRSGYVISCCIPLILLGAFAGMYVMNIDLHKISLGTLVLALGMLVDDAIVVVELMEVKMSEGMERKAAASYAFKTCAWPLLTGTIITCLGFMPIAFSKSTSSEYAGTLFPVMTITLILSWVISATLAPVLGYEWLKPGKIQKESYDSVFYQRFRALLHWSLNHRLLIIAGFVGCFILSLGLLKFVKRDFFPAATRPELLVEINTAEGSSIKNTDVAAKKLTEFVLKDKDLEHVSTYVGESSPRFVLVLEPVMPRSSYAQLVVVAKDVAARERLKAKIDEFANKELPECITYAQTIPLGPPSPYPVMIRVSGPDKTQVKAYAQKVRETMSQHPYVTMTRNDWLEESNAVRLTIDNDKLLQMGLTRQTVSSALQAQVTGYSVAQYLEKDQEIDLVFRLDASERTTLEQLATVAIPTSKGAVPLAQIAKIDFGTEDSMIWRRNQLPTITVCGAIVDGVTGNDVTKQVYEQLQPLREKLPLGVTIEIGGNLEQSNKTLHNLLKPVPIMLLLVIILIMLLLQDVRKLIIILLTVPMGTIGVFSGLLLFNSPLGFMAELGILALSGTIVRNSMVLVDQIDQHLAQGMEPLEAITESAIVRFRPIMLAAFTTVLGLIPLLFSQFWNSMAVSIACGLTGATLITLVLLPVLYAIAFKVK